MLIMCLAFLPLVLNVQSSSHTTNTHIDWRSYGFDDDYLSTNAAVSRLAGFWYCCCQAIYSYGGTTIIGITANEAERQREVLPQAVRRVSQRLIFYYGIATFALGLSLWSKDPLLGSLVKGTYYSPYVIMVERSGVPGLPHLVNALVLVATVSTANANLYETVMLYLPPFQCLNCRAGLCTLLLPRVTRRKSSFERISIRFHTWVLWCPP